MKLSMGKINYLCGIFFGILTYLVIPIEYEKLCLIPICIACAINIIYILFFRLKLNVNVAISGIMVLYTFFLVLTSKYRQDYAFRAWITLFMLAFFSSNGIKRLSKRHERAIWILALSLLIYRAIVSPRMYEGQGSPIFQTAFYDRIETELCIILFMFYSVKIQMISGVIYTVAYYFLLSSSRGTLLMIVLFFGIRYGKDIVITFTKKVIHFFRKRKRIKILAALALIAFIVFSYYWVFVVSKAGVVEHGDGIVDTSNFSRFASTIFAIEELMMKHNLWFSGFGSDLKTVMGVADGNNVKYMGQWLVQSHNSMLNVLLCLGYIPGILYLGIVFNIIRKYFKVENLEYIVGIVLYSFIIVIIGKKGLDVFWLFILMIPEKKPFWEAVISRFSNKKRKILSPIPRRYVLEIEGRQRRC